MRTLFIVLLLAMLLASGCSTIKLVPEKVDSGVVSSEDNSQTISRNGITLKVAPSDTEINSYNLDGMVAAFVVVLKNDTDGEVAYSEDSFVLVDEKGAQYNLLTPEKLKEILKKDSYYLMPYPYVGFYYLEDFQKTNFYNRFNPTMPNYYELYPQDLFTRSFPLTPVIPGMRTEGLVYFKIDLRSHQQVKLYVYRKGAPRTVTPDFAFPFRIVK